MCAHVCLCTCTRRFTCNFMFACDYASLSSHRATLHYTCSHSWLAFFILVFPPQSRVCVAEKVSRHAAGEQLTLHSQARCTAVGGLRVPVTWQGCVWKYALSRVKHQHRLLLAPVQLIRPPTHGKALFRNHAPPVSVPRQALLFHLDPSLCLG